MTMVYQKLYDIDIQIGRTGALTPEAKILKLILKLNVVVSNTWHFIIEDIKERYKLMMK